MKTNHIFTGLLVFGSVLTMNAQDQVSNSSLTSGGDGAGHSGFKSTYYGVQAGHQSDEESNSNTFVGFGTGSVNKTGSNNTFLGHKAGFENYKGNFNVFLGSNAGLMNNDGEANVMVGYSSGNNNTVGLGNVYVGNFSGGDGPQSPQYNTYIGNYAGYKNDGNSNVFIGNMTGASASVDHKLYISNNDDPTPLIWGDFKADLAKVNGKLGTGNLVNFPSMAGAVSVDHYSIFAMGGILTEELRIMRNQDWADYVFQANYKLATLDEVESFIKNNGHLPNVPSAAEIKRDGMEVGEMAKIQQEKIEELTLYLIEQKKQNEKQDQEIKELKALVQQLTEKK